MNAVFSLTPAEIVAKYRVSMQEIAGLAQVDQHHVPPQYDCFQLKYDGWWIAVRILGDQIQLITSGAEIRKTIQIENPLQVKALLLGEWMYGTNWAGKHNPGQIFIHDIVYWDDTSDEYSYFDGHSYSTTYIARLSMLKNIHTQLIAFRPLLNPVQTYGIDTLAEVWNDNIPEYEGVVLKDSHSGLGADMIAAKIKPDVTEDYVVMGFNEGSGRLKGNLGALQGGLYVNGTLTSICSVGGGFTDVRRTEIWNNKEKYLGKVFKAYGKAKFASGALRHSNFDMWREDKLPTQCVRK